MDFLLVVMSAVLQRLLQTPTASRREEINEKMAVGQSTNNPHSSLGLAKAET